MSWRKNRLGTHFSTFFPTGELQQQRSCVQFWLAERKPSKHFAVRYEAHEVLERWLERGPRFAIVFSVWLEAMWWADLFSKESDQMSKIHVATFYELILNRNSPDEELLFSSVGMLIGK
jgi:hypothetical protein